MSETRQKFSPEVRERAVRLVREARGEPPSEWATLCAIGAKLGCTSETLRKWVRQAEHDSGNGTVPATDDRQRLLERENRELRRANEILRKASASFAAAALDRSVFS